MSRQQIDYTADGVRMRGFLARPEKIGASEALPGVLVVHDAGGLGEGTRHKCTAIASLGYVAFALDLFGDENPGMDGLEKIKRLGADIPRWRARAQAGLDVLAAQPGVDAHRLAAIGYCFGGTTVYELARSGADLKAVIGFHSGLVPRSSDSAKIKGKLLCLIGADDPLITPAQRVSFEEELRAAKIDWQMNIYGNTGHSFTNPALGGSSRPGFAYSPASDERSFWEMQRLLGEVFEREDLIEPRQ